MLFRPESTDPRQQRAYAEALLTTALATNEPADKLAAVLAANRASNTNKGSGQGQERMSDTTSTPAPSAVITTNMAIH